MDPSLQQGKAQRGNGEGPNPRPFPVGEGVPACAEGSHGREGVAGQSEACLEAQPPVDCRCATGTETICARLGPQPGKATCVLETLDFLSC